MKKSFSIIVAVALLVSNLGSIPVSIAAGSTEMGQPGSESSPSYTQPEYVPGEVIVKFKDQEMNLQNSSGLNEARAFAATENAYVKDQVEPANLAVLKTKGNETVESMMERIQQDPSVESVQPNFQYYPYIPFDPDMGKQWALNNYAQEVNGVTGTADADIDATEAWGIDSGMNGTAIVAVIDDGVAYNHPDLIGNMWNGATCVDENGAPLGGCNHGYDYQDDDNTPLPTSGTHGTHIAGTIAATRLNAKGIAGLAPYAKIMALKTSYTTAENVKAINFAKENGAKVINASWGVYGAAGSADQALYDAISGFPGIFVTAAGNSGFNQEDSNPDHMSYPAGFKLVTPLGPALTNIISVAATDQFDALAGFSNYGASTVDVGAPGVNIFSTIADSTVLDEQFETTIPPAMPAGWVGSPGGFWQTFDYGSGLGNVLYGDIPFPPYHDGSNSTATSPLNDLSGASGANLGFLTRCDTEYAPPADGYDYMALEFSNDGFATNTQVMRWNEWLLGQMNSNNDPTGAQTYYFSWPIAETYLTGAFQFRFRWVTNNTDNAYWGCIVDLMNLTQYSDGLDEKYGFLNGTSVAAPYVSGLAGLLWGYNPNLTMSQVKDDILATGDPLPSLSGKTVTGKRINAYNALAVFKPTVGYTADDIIPAGEVTQSTDGDGIVTVHFKLKDGVAGLPVTLSEFAYSTDGGNTWVAPSNGDSSASLGTNWNDNSYVTSIDYNGTEYSFTWDTTHTDLTGLADISQDDVQIGFVANDGATTGDPGTSESFTVDNVAPDAPLITDPVAPFSTNELTYIITGTAEINSLVNIYDNTDAIVGFQQMGDGSTIFPITVDLQANAVNVFHATATDAFGNESTPFTISGITQDSGGVISSISNVGGDTVAPYFTKNATPDVVVSGEAGMSCRWGESDAGYSAMSNNCGVLGAEATCSLSDQSPDGSKIVYISCKDAANNEQTASDNMDVPFTLDRMPPVVTSATALPDPAKAGTVTVTVNFDEALSGLDYASSPSVNITGLTTAYPVTQSTFAGNIWTGTFTLLDEDEVATGTITVTGAADLLGNVMVDNPAAGTFTVDTIAPTADLTVTLPAASPDTSAIPSADITVGGTQVTYYKYKLDGGSYSAETPVATHIILPSVLNGDHEISVLGRDSAGNWQEEVSATTYSWTVSDTTAPDITGLANDAVITRTKDWTWASTDSSAQFRYAIDQSATWTASGAYGNTKTATQADGDGTYYLHVQAKDINGNESDVVTVSAILDNSGPTVTKLGTGVADVVLPIGDTNLIFNEPLDLTSRTMVQNTLTSGADKTLTYSWTGGTLKISATAITTFANDVVASVSDALGNTTLELLLVDSVYTSSQAIPDGTGAVTLNNTTPEALITDPNQPVTVTVAAGTTAPTINVDAFITGGTGTLPAITIDSANAGGVLVEIPAGTVVTSADNTWNGIFSAPKTTTVSLPVVAGETRTLSTAIEIGFSGAKLSFDKGVKIVLPGQASKMVGYTRPGLAFTEITAACAADNQATGNALPADGDCKINAVPDMVVWTKHFTAFATFSSVATPVVVPVVTPVSSGGGGGGGGGGGSGVSRTAKTTTTTSNTTMSALNTIEKTINERKTFSGPIEFATGMVTTDAKKVNATVKITGPEGFVTLKPNSNSTIFVTIPSDTTVTGITDWDHKIEPPHVLTTLEIRKDGEVIENTKDMLMRSDVSALIGIGSNVPLTFTKDITITVPLDLPDGSEVNVYKSDDGVSWIAQGTAVVKNGTAVIKTDHLTNYAFGKTVSAQEQTRTTGSTPSVTSTGSHYTAPSAPEQAGAAFRDISDHWAEPYINVITDLGIVDGKTRAAFIPNEAITRAELIKIAVKAFDISVEPAADYKPYSDVETTAWYAPYIIAAQEQGIIDGYGMEFKPNSKVNRAEALKILIEAAGFKGVEKNYQLHYAQKPGYYYTAFKDVPLVTWYAKYVAFARDNNLVTGYEDGLFGSGKIMTRGEVAKIVVKMLEMK